MALTSTLRRYRYDPLKGQLNYLPDTGALSPQVRRDLAAPMGTQPTAAYNKWAYGQATRSPLSAYGFELGRAGYEPAASREAVAPTFDYGTPEQYKGSLRASPAAFSTLGPKTAAWLQTTSEQQAYEDKAARAKQALDVIMAPLSRTTTPSAPYPYNAYIAPQATAPLPAGAAVPGAAGAGAVPPSAGAPAPPNPASYTFGTQDTRYQNDYATWQNTVRQRAAEAMLGGGPAPAGAASPYAGMSTEQLQRMGGGGPGVAGMGGGGASQAQLAATYAPNLVPTAAGPGVGAMVTPVGGTFPGVGYQPGATPYQTLAQQRAATPATIPAAAPATAAIGMGMDLGGVLGPAGFGEGYWIARKQRAEGDARAQFSALREQLEDQARRGNVSSAYAARRRQEIDQKERQSILQGQSAIESERTEQLEKAKLARADAYLRRYATAAPVSAQLSIAAREDTRARDLATASNTLQRDLAVLEDERVRAINAGDNVRAYDLAQREDQMRRDLTQAQNELQWHMQQSRQGFEAGTQGAQMGLQWATASAEQARLRDALAAQQEWAQRQAGAELLRTAPTGEQGWTNIEQYLRGAGYQDLLTRLAGTVRARGGGGGPTPPPAFRPEPEVREPWRAGPAPAAPTPKTAAEIEREFFGGRARVPQPAFPGGRLEVVPPMTPKEFNEFVRRWKVRV